MGALLALALLLLAAPAAVQCLSPPWWVAYGMFHAVLRHDRCLNVSDLVQPGAPASFTYSFNITVCQNASEDKLSGLATFLTQRHNFGGTLFLSHVLDSTGSRQRPSPPDSGERGLELAQAALEGNRYFGGTAVSRPWPCIPFYWAIFTPDIIQLWIDNLADLWGNISLPAADLFVRVFRLEQFGIRGTTLPFGMLGSAADGSQLARQQGQQANGMGQQQAGQLDAVLPLVEHWQRQQQWQQQQQQQEATMGADRRLLVTVGGGSGAFQYAASGWQQAAQCWAVGMVQRAAGDVAALKLQAWML